VISKEGMVSKGMDSEDVELLKMIADGTTYFRPVQDEPSDSPRWTQQVERLRQLRTRGLIGMPEPEMHDDQPGYPAGVGPCELTADGGRVLDKFRA
jgi:hypothetical protein